MQFIGKMWLGKFIFILRLFLGSKRPKQKGQNKQWQKNVEQRFCYKGNFCCQTAKGEECCNQGNSKENNGVAEHKKIDLLNTLISKELPCRVSERKNPIKRKFLNRPGQIIQLKNNLFPQQ